MVSIGSSNNLIYDNCAYQKEIYESTAPLSYNLYQGKFENCQKCIYNKFWTPYELVDIESELRNQVRPLSHCDQLKYAPDCKKSKLCLSTYDKSVPVAFHPTICPIVYNNIIKNKAPGYKLPKKMTCKSECNLAMPKEMRTQRCQYNKKA